MQTMAFVAKTPWYEQTDLDAAAQANQSKMMVVAGKRLAAARADGSFFSFDPE